jgi:outer membrane receptor protein involved in Fe transport
MKDSALEIFAGKKSIFSKGISLLALLSGSTMLAAPAWAQGELGDSVRSASASEIVVTGSRIMRDGYDAPTPVSVLGAAELEASAPENIADLVNQLPGMGTSENPQTQGGQISNGGTGINSLNLRDLGSVRTLVLLDGKRVPAATLTGLVDVNFLPHMLVKRVDVVTGGASAAYGSDAVAGVVNFVLDKDFTGIKTLIQGGISNYGDDENYKLGFAAGSSFADGRGHVLVSAEHSFKQGIKGYPRPWYTGAKLMLNPSYAVGNGQPYYLVAPAGFTTAAPGAIVTTGALKGLYFGPGGTPAQLNTGLARDPYVVGGDWQYTDFGNGPQDIDPRVSRQSVFGYASFDVSDSVKLYAQAAFARTHTSMNSTPAFVLGGITIQRDNAFLPQEIVDRMTDLGLNTLNVGTWNADYGGILTETTRKQQRYVVGASGSFDMLGSDWKWDAYYNRNVSNIFNSAFPYVRARYDQAIDAVRDANGVIVCRSTLTNPNNGCVPYNMLGTGTASEAAINYVRGNTWLRSKLTQDVVAAALSGQPFATWAGPVSIALGAEHRREKIRSKVDDLSLTNAYWAGNYKPLNGAYSVTEAYVEAAVPLVADMLDANLAARATDYSSSGYVTTWKVGLNFTPIEDIRVRLTRSRDIRAGNLSELYAEGQTQTASINDPFRGGASTTYFQVTSGTLNLKPEKADTFTAGVVLRPRFLPGLTASVDYFDIRVKDVLASLSFADILGECYRGDQLLCSQIERDSNGVLTVINRTPVNFQARLVRGLDFELGYRVPIGKGDLTLRAMATHYLKSELDNGLTVPNSSLGELRGGVPNWKYRMQATYSAGPISLTAVGRGVSDGVYDVNYIGCENNCPLYTANNPTISTNHIDGTFYVDLSATVTPKALPGIKMVFAVDNVANRAPSVAARGTGVGSGPLDTYGFYFDMIGRRFRVALSAEF